MRAIVNDSKGVRFEGDYPAPTAVNGDVLVRVLRAGICETDLQLIRGYMDFQGVLGHEFVGVALEGRLKGQRVVGEINCGCGECAFCRGGLRNHCPNRAVIGILNRDGAFADYVAVPELNLHVVPSNVDTDKAVFVEPLAAAYEIPAQLSLHDNDRIVVLGDGRLGNLCAQVLHKEGCRVTVVGKHPKKLELLGRLQINTLHLKDAQPDRSADVVVDCTGSETGLSTALRFVRPRGTIVLKTTIAGQHEASLAQLVIDEITLVGSRCGPFDRAIRALASREIEVQPLISARYRLDEAEEAFSEADRTPVLKVLLDVSGE